MKKMVVLLVFAVLTIGAIVNSAVADVEKFGTISGVVIDVQAVPSKSFWSVVDFTTVRFSDGRVVNFSGILVGASFHIGKMHHITYYTYDWRIYKVVTDE